MKPINITEQVVVDMAREFVQELYKTGRVKTDSFSYKKNFASVKKDAVEVNFTYEAYSQMFALIDHFDCEVAWRGIVNRIDKTHFQITKILLYPQTVTGTTVDTDQEEFSKWFQALPVETIRNLRFQGHSHVDFGVTPSSRDMEDQWRFIDGLKPTSYQIFMIWNKKRQYNVRVIDLADNVIYEGADVKVTVGDFDSTRFLEDADKTVRKRPVYVASTVANYGAYGAGTYYGKAVTPQKTYPQTVATQTPVPQIKTVTGAAAPKVNEVSETRYPLVNYYKENPEDLDTCWNSSCFPYDN